LGQDLLVSLELAMTVAVNATRITVDSRYDFATTRARFDDLVGNPAIAQTMVVRQRAAVLFAPFPVAVYADSEGTHVTYLRPSSLLGSLQSARIDQVARKLDTNIEITIEETCRWL
jgi:Domain of unknown function DUF302